MNWAKHRVFNTFQLRVLGFPTWEFASVPDDDGVVHTAGGQPHVMRRPRHVHYICKQSTKLWPLNWRRVDTSEEEVLTSHSFMTSHSQTPTHDAKKSSGKQCCTSGVVPQDGDAPPLLHVGQLAARPEHGAGTDQSAEKTQQRPFDPAGEDWTKTFQHPEDAPVVCVSVHTQLASTPWPACRLLLTPGTAHCWTSAHSSRRLQTQTNTSAEIQIVWISAEEAVGLKICFHHHIWQRERVSVCESWYLQQL